MKAGSHVEPAFTVSLPLPPESSSDAIALLEPLALGEGFGGFGGGHVGLDAMGDEGFDGSGEAVAGGDDKWGTISCLFVVSFHFCSYLLCPSSVSAQLQTGR